jgi:hypothetical protein
MSQITGIQIALNTANVFHVETVLAVPINHKHPGLYCT